MKYEIIDGKTKIKSYFSDTLTFFKDKIIPFIINPKDKEIEEVEFETDYCFGSCPVYKLTINKNRDVYYNGIKFVEKLGEYNLKIDEVDWQYI